MNEKLKQILIPDAKSETPLYQQIADTLRSLIDNRTLCAGEKIPPTRELCESFGVSAITVEAGIRKLVEESYLVRRPRRGTFVNPEPGKLPEAEGRLTVRFIFGEVDLNDIYWYVVLNALERSPLIGNADKLFTSLQSGELSEARIDELVAGCAGLILCGYSSLRFAEALNRRNVPFAMIGGFRSDAAVPFDIDAVVHDDVHRAYLSTRHLIDLGHRDICCVAGPGGSRLCRDIEAGCRVALKECGVPERNFDFSVVSRHSIDEGREAGLRLRRPAGRRRRQGGRAARVPDSGRPLHHRRRQPGDRQSHDAGTDLDAELPRALRRAGGGEAAGPDQRPGTPQVRHRPADRRTGDRRNHAHPAAPRGRGDSGPARFPPDNGKTITERMIS